MSTDKSSLEIRMGRTTEKLNGQIGKGLLSEVNKYEFKLQEEAHDKWHSIHHNPKKPRSFHAHFPTELILIQLS